MVAAVEERYKVTGEAHNWSDGGVQRFPGLDCLSRDACAPDTALPARFQHLNQTTWLVFCYIQIRANQLMYTLILKNRDKNSAGISALHIS